jgi:GT2 family glycosyltransferase
MADGPKTSFVIASRDRCDELALVVARLLDTTVCPIVVVDNASRDDSVAVLRRMAARSSDRLSVIALDHNAGAVARNVGVAHCATAYVAFCDDDSWWSPDAPAIAEALFDAYPTVALLAARTVLMPHGVDDPLVAEMSASPLGRDPALPGPSVLGFLACSSIVRTAAFEAAGGFSPILHFRGEERLLAWDIAAHGWDLCFCPALIAYHQPSTNRPPSADAVARSLRNDVLTTWLRRPPRQCARAAAQLARSAAADAACARALGEAVARIPAVLRARHRLPADVEQSVCAMES